MASYPSAAHNFLASPCRADKMAAWLAHVAGGTFARIVVRISGTQCDGRQAEVNCCCEVRSMRNGLRRQFALKRMFGVLFVALVDFETSLMESAKANEWIVASGSWFNSDNWSSTEIPASSDYVDIINGGTATVDGPDAVAGPVYLGNTSGTTGTLNVLGDLDCLSLEVGNAGHGTLSIASGGVLNTSFASIDGPTVGSTATVDAAEWNIGDLIIGATQKGKLTISNEGKVYSEGYGITLGQQQGSTGEAIVMNTDSTWFLFEDTPLTVGELGTGILTVNAGAVLDSSYAILIAKEEDSSGTVTVDGNNAKLIAEDIFVGGNFNGPGGEGHLEIKTSAVVHVKDEIVVRQNSDLNVAGRLIVTNGDADSLGATSGIRVDGFNGNIAYLELVQGAKAGADATISQVAIGISQDSQGYVRVNGTDPSDSESPTILRASQILVGNLGRGDLDVLNGALVECASASIGIGGPLSNGDSSSVFVSGESAKLIVHGTIQVGVVGDGLLDISFGARVEAADVNVGTASSGDANGSVVVIGTGSHLEVANGLSIGAGGRGELVVGGGATVNSASGQIAAVGGSAVAKVDGTWNAGSSVAVGGAGFATLEIGSDGTVETSLLTISSSSKLIGSGTIDGDVQNNGFISIDADGDETLTITGTLFQTSTSMVEINATSTSNTKLQVQDVQGTGATLKVKLEPDYIPLSTDELEIIYVEGGVSGGGSAMFGRIFAISPDGTTGKFSTIVADDTLKITNFQLTLPGDYNGDDSVDAADYVVWRKSNDSTPEQFETWREHFGESTLGSGAAATSLGSPTSPVPEPTTIAPLLLTTVMLRRRGRRPK